MVRNALSEVRRIIYDLRPMALDDLGIVPTLGNIYQRLKNITQLVKFISNHMEKKSDYNPILK